MGTGNFEFGKYYLVLNNKLEQHIKNEGNPHHISKETLGLDLVDNTADLDKPVSRAQAEAISNASETDLLRAKEYADAKVGIETARAVASEQDLRDLINLYKPVISLNDGSIIFDETSILKLFRDTLDNDLIADTPYFISVIQNTPIELKNVSFGSAKVLLKNCIDEVFTVPYTSLFYKASAGEIASWTNVYYRQYEDSNLAKVGLGYPVIQLGEYGLTHQPGRLVFRAKPDVKKIKLSISRYFYFNQEDVTTIDSVDEDAKIKINGQLFDADLEPSEVEVELESSEVVIESVNGRVFITKISAGDEEFRFARNYFISEAAENETVRVPVLPEYEENGTYSLKATKTSSGVEYFWQKDN